MNHGPGLTFRFLAAQVLVVVISLMVAAAVATTVGPTLFHDHMLMAGREGPSLELFHAEQAYRDANLITLAVALPTALISALLASLWLSRRLRTPCRISPAPLPAWRPVTPVSACPPEKQAPRSPPWRMPSTPWPTGWNTPNRSAARCSLIWPTKWAPLIGAHGLPRWSPGRGRGLE